MGVQAHILSFDEAKKTVGKPRPSVAAQKAAAKKPAKRNSSTSLSAKPSDSSRGSSRKQDAQKASSKGSPQKKSALRPSAKNISSHKKSVKSAAKNQIPLKVKKSNAASRTDEQKNASAQRKSMREKQNVDPRSSKKVSKFSDAKRSRNKDKAGKAFTKQFGDTSAEASSGGPRAAVYKGEMGRQHKKATKMQSGKAVGFLSRFSFEGFRGSPLFIGTAMLVAGLALSCAFLYPSAKQYYVTVREHDQVLAEYEAVQGRNGKIQSQVDSLSTAEGIEDRARAEYGWVKEGENAVMVRGLDIDKEKSSFTEGIPTGSVEAPETWYSSVLDKIFGV